MLWQNELELELKSNRMTQKHNSHFFIPLFIDLYHNSTQIGTLQINLATITKEVYIPSNVTSIFIRTSKNIPAIIKQSSPDLLLSIPFERLSIETLLRELRSRYYLLRNREESVSTFLPFIAQLMEYYDSCFHYPAIIVTQLLSILKELRMALRENLSLLPRLDEWIQRLFSHYRDHLLQTTWKSMDSLQKSAGKNTLFFLLWVHDPTVETFIDRKFGEKTIEFVELEWLNYVRTSEIPGDFQEMVALRYFQKRITKENFMYEIDRVVSKVYANQNSNIITPLSLLETDEMIAYLFKQVIWERSSLYTQNILYLFSYLNQNISF